MQKSEGMNGHAVEALGALPGEMLFQRYLDGDDDCMPALISRYHRVLYVTLSKPS